VNDFTGFPEAALAFYDDLEMDNTKSFWEAHKPMYLEAVKTPMLALTEALRTRVRHCQGVPPVPRHPLREREVNSFRVSRKSSTLQRLR